MTDKIKTGSIGENLAAEFLVNKGFTVVARNYRWKKAEIDLIVQRENWLIFVEVKTRSSNSFGEPESFVSDYQRKLIYDAAEEYIYSKDWRGHIRFDIVSVKPGIEPEIVHFEDAIVV
ncbi:MAG TPA: YraN family protein [Chryseosolibacter sp.]|nr:YraN family protein [Chryseosolibacter sp.]